jgi:4-amino-4-deoxy-L-arabinose transferase-like glycosyltransferase
VLLIACWAGTALRTSALFANRFHADEALFAGWARLIAVWRDPLLLSQAVDKPPLLFYLQAFAYPLLGPVEWAARLPNFVASLMLIPLTGMLAWRVFRDSMAAVTAASLTAVAPLAIQFSATAFSDPLLTFWLVAALFFAARPVKIVAKRELDQPFWAGCFFGLALATKYQAMLFLPLILGFAWLNHWRGREWRWALAGLLMAIVPFGLWMIARADADGLVGLQWANIGGLRLAWSWELWPRLVAQARLWELALGRPLTLAIALMAFALIMTSRSWSRKVSPYDGLLALFVTAYILLHWLWAVPVWDRYLLPILPLVAILIGRGISWLLGAERQKDPARRSNVLMQIGTLALILLLGLSHLPTAAAARDGRFSIGGRPSADGGAADVARLLADAPYGTVLYDHWYSWHWRYQLFDKRVYISWFPHADALLADLAVFGESDTPRFIALPVSDVAKPVLRRLAEAGYRLTAIGQPDPAAEMRFYHIERREE